MPRTGLLGFLAGCPTMAAGTLRPSALVLLLLFLHELL